MAGFTAPEYSSSPAPSTPGKKYGFRDSNNPSTTPAGPPPSSSGSFTPAGPPPSSVIGSSLFGNTSNRPIKPLSFTSKPTPNFGESVNLGQSQLSQFLHQDYSEDEENSYDDYQQDQDNQYSQNQNYGGQHSVETEEDEPMEVNNNWLQRSTSDLLPPTPAPLRQSRGGSRVSISRQSRYGQLAKNESRRLGFAVVDESDDLILNTETLVNRLIEEGVGGEDEDADYVLERALTIVPRELTELWAAYNQKNEKYESEEHTATIGPGNRASNFSKANFVGGLSLKVNHPTFKRGSETIIAPLPQTLLEWIDEHHDPYTYQIEEVQAHRPSPANHPDFWRTVYYGLLRGRVVAVVNLLRGAGWRHAVAGMDDVKASGPGGRAGYTGLALQNVERVIGKASDVLSLCPAATGDWDIRSSDWTSFRIRIAQARDELRTFAEGKNRKLNDSIDFSMSGPAEKSFGATARRAESQVPWTIYQQLLTLYSLVLGDQTAIMTHAQDWCESTIALLLWWDEGKEDRRTFGRSQAKILSKESESKFYTRKLRRAFELATSDAEEENFQPNTANLVELALASLFEGDNEAVVSLLQAWSGPVSSALVEIGNIAGWLPPAEQPNLMKMSEFDDDDMNVLGMDSGATDSVKDQVLIAYAKAVAQRELLQDGSQSYHGWEMSIALLGRLDTAARSEDKIEEFLKDFPLDSSATADKLWRLLNKIGMDRHAEDVAEKFADGLAEHSHKYGEALWYYALSHKPQKVKDVLNLLISYSLIQSTAYPAEEDLDDHLKSLISSATKTLLKLSGMDFEAAELLKKTLSGYATIRAFYILRDEESSGQRPRKSALARKEEAVSALLAVITSSDDNIRGGLYDEQKEAVVNVDFLLALLGEAMVFINQPDFSLSVSQIETLLKAIEDIQTVGSRVRAACTEFLQTVIASGQGLKGSSPSQLLRKSTSGMSGESSFSLVGSSMLASQLKQSMGGSGVMVQRNIKRAWDWRSGVSANTTAEDLLRILRLGLAQDLARAWMMEADNRM